MEVKTFEIRDGERFVAAMGVYTEQHELTAQQKFLFRRAGRAGSDSALFLFPMDETPSFGWDDGKRAYAIAHRYIRQNWHRLCDGQVVDVEYILGITSEPQTTENDEWRRQSCTR